MKISIITVCLNSQNTLADTINSVNSQTYKNIEHIFVDGGSKDETIKILRKNPNKKKRVFIKKNYGIYKSMNFGIKQASGEIIQILNSDDIYQSNDKLTEVVKSIKKYKNYGVYLGNVVFFKNNLFYKIKRYYKANIKKIENLREGQMPPHPAAFVRKKIYLENKLYRDELKIASDFDFFNTIFNTHKIKYKFLNNNVVRMRAGGISNKNLISYFKISKEIIYSLKKNNQKYNLFRIYLRFINKIPELINLNYNKLNKDFELFNIHFFKEKYNLKTFKVLKKIQFLKLKKNFILSGMNLAYLGYFSKNILSKEKKIIFWPDGIYVEKFLNIKKIPGRDVLKKLKLNKQIKKINVIGNISKNAEKYLKSRYKKKINHIEIPYLSIEAIKKIDIRINKNELTFITLPTPKQELLAKQISKLNKSYKIICIGGSIAIACGDETKVPQFFSNVEFLWRLQTDTVRRIKRLLETFFGYVRGKYIYNLFDELIFRIIEKK